MNYIRDAIVNGDVKAGEHIKEGSRPSEIALVG